jgi:trehalose 6-phosphate synthase/phosphatase
MKFIFVSNRLPVTIEKKRGRLAFKPSVGGLATGLQSFYQSYESIWIGWDGMPAESLSPEEQREVKTTLREEYRNHTVPLTRNDIKLYYHGFSNRTIWPLFHYFPTYTVYDRHLWDAYKRVNEKFREAVVSVAKPDDVIWIHDYQLMLLPQLIREKLPDTQIGFFLHIPFPSFEIFRLLPWRREVLSGLIGADLVGFHTFDYVRHFLSSVRRLLGFEISLGGIQSENRYVKADVFPMGIDYKKYSEAYREPKVDREIARIRRSVGDRKLILSVDRLDYTKGILERLDAFDQFLKSHPQYQNRVTLILVAVPSRTSVETYMRLKRELDEKVGRLNGQYGTIDWIPVWYLYRSLPFPSLAALYNMADVALVTPLRDGMNLIAKEFIASRGERGGVLVLSGMAGAVHELSEALIVNPHNRDQVSESLKEALEMPWEEQLRANGLMQERLKRYNVERWARDFMEGLQAVREQQKKLAVRKLSSAVRRKLMGDYCSSARRLLFLDYDGTIAPFFGIPGNAHPDSELLGLLCKLGEDRRNELVIVSGRDRDVVEGWFEGVQAGLVAEHGVWLKEGDSNWYESEPLKGEWQETIKPVLELFTDRTPGSLLEEKSHSLVWHYRMADPDLASLRVVELREALLNLIENYNLAIIEGNKTIEVKSAGVDKGTAALRWLGKGTWDFILAAGDDDTDEPLFQVLPPHAYSIRVGHDVSKARYNLPKVRDVISLLRELAGVEGQ